MSDPQLADVARVCNRYPDIDIDLEVVGGEKVTAGEQVTVQVSMERTLAEGQELAPVHAPRSVSVCHKLYCLCSTFLRLVGGTHRTRFQF